MDKHAAFTPSPKANTSTSGPHLDCDSLESRSVFYRTKDQMCSTASPPVRPGAEVSLRPRKAKQTSWTQPRRRLTPHLCFITTSLTRMRVLTASLHHLGTSPYSTLSSTRVQSAHDASYRWKWMLTYLFTHRDACAATVLSSSGLAYWLSPDLALFQKFSLYIIS